MPSKLELFMEKHRVLSDSDKPTHTSMVGGKWKFNSDEYDDFLQLYCNHINDNDGPLYFTEISTEEGALRVDLDLNYPGEHSEHKHTREQIVNFTKAYLEEVKKVHALPAQVEVFVMEKPEPYFDKSKNRTKAGVHLLIPSVISNSHIEQHIRNMMLKKMPEIFAGLPQTDGDWGKVYDMAPVKRSCPWTLLGSRKKESKAYQLKYCIDWCTEDGEIGIDDEMPLKLTPAWVKRMSTRIKPGEIMTPVLEEAKDLFKPKKHREDDDVRISGGSAVLRGRQIRSDTSPGSRTSSPGRGTYLYPLTPIQLEYYTELANNLSSERYMDYHKWVEVGVCLKNIHPDLCELWHSFSSKYEKYDRREADNKWNSFGFRTDGDRLSEKSLIYWSRTDNPARHTEIQQNTLQALIAESARTGTEHDVACVVYHRYRDDFKCVRYGTNIWYQYIGHIWREIDKGVDLQRKLSSDIAKEYHAMGEAEYAKIRGLECTNDGKKGECVDPSCAKCEAEKRFKMYDTIRNKLKTTRFKENVMKECRELFLDTEFINKVDENKNLIAFNNGVFDCLAMKFRDGAPEDYISFSTGIDYDVEKNYYDYDCWSQLDKFIHDVLPDNVVREYFIKHMSTCIAGGNDAQKFHILTGSGSNGKSMLMNLMSTALGDYSVKVPISLLTQGRNKSSAASPELVRIKGRRFVTMQEPDEGVPLNTGLMKELASSEKITARDLYAGSKAMIDFDVQAKFHLACNEKPKINTTDGGTWRRLVVVNFLTKFIAEPRAANERMIDDSIVAKVVSKEWATCFMAYLLHVFKEGKGHRKLNPPPVVLEYTNDYREDNDVIARFIREHIRPVVKEEGAPESFTLMTEVSGVYRTWKMENEIGPRGTSVGELRKRLEAQFAKMPKRGWTSFRVSSDASA